MTTLDPFGLPPDEAIRWFQEKGFKLGFDWRDTWTEQHARAFTVAKATQLDVLADLRESVDRALKEGRTLSDFRKELRPTLQAKGWWGEKTMVDPETGEEKLVQLGSASRLRTIYETNLRTAQAAGRWERFERVKARRPYGRYVALSSARPEHRAWHGTVLPLDDPWWDTHAPPNGWGCRCKMQQLSDRDLERFGFEVNDKAPPSPSRAFFNERTGETVRVPKGIDPGFEFNPGKAERAFQPERTPSPVLTPVKGFRDYELAPARTVERKPAPDAWPPESRVRLLERFKDLFQGKDEASVADPQGMQTTFSKRHLDDAKRATSLPSAKATIERPDEVWLVPFRQPDGRVVMRKRYVAFYGGPDGGKAVVVERGDDGYATWQTLDGRAVDAQRKGYLLGGTKAA